ncbi:hypothetical protein [Flavobacterium sp. 83]|uniref:hypothetical protein n=1 Tax=Flavobacterium sp. 83 TaxID=1131812 RepID=UPI0005537CFC|nr:hypothetical protein [Flavobacterium sp. 83]
MKKITLLVASIFIIGGGVANATEKTNFSHERRSPVDFRNADPIVFTERGIEFFVFPDGQFDFNTRPSTSSDMYYKSTRTSAVNKTYGAPTNFRNQNYGVKVEHDNSGKVRRIGNVFINYDSNDRIKRVGSVYMTYNRYALEQVGGLQIIYNRRGQIIDIVGSVKGRRANEYSQNNYDNNDRDYRNNQNNDDYDNRDIGNTQNSNDQDQYYYRTNGTKAKIEDTKVTGSLDIRVDKR